MCIIIGLQLNYTSEDTAFYPTNCSVFSMKIIHRNRYFFKPGNCMFNPFNNFCNCDAMMYSLYQF